MQHSYSMFKSSNKSNIFITIFIIFFANIRMPIDLSVKYYQKNKEKLQKNL